MSKPQVRLDPDVAEALHRDAERHGTSLNVAANTWLRRALGLRSGSEAPGGRAPGGASDTLHTAGEPSRVATITTAVPVSPTDCKHPANRRIGPYCAACRTTLKVPKPVAR